MAGKTFRVGRIFQNLLRLITVHGFYFCHPEYTLCQSTGLVKYHISGLGQRLQIIGALDQNTVCRCSSDSCKKAQRNGNHQRTRTADNQKGQGSGDPGPPGRRILKQQVHQRRQHRQRQRTVANHRRIISGKFRDKILTLRFLHAGIFHKLQNFRYCGLTKFFCGTDLQKTAHIDAAAKYSSPRPDFPGYTFAGKGTGIQGRHTFHHLAVNRHLFSRTHQDQSSNLHIIRIHLLQLSILALNIGIIRANVHQRRNVPAALAHGNRLEQLTNLVKQHYCHALRKIAQGNRAYGSHSHQEIFIKNFSVQNA